jgi:putative glycosyltransferase (TIGR04372 family)
MGTPVLQTNTTSIARNMLRASKGSLFLPKQYRDKNARELSFRDIAQGRLGYAESTVKELNRLGIQISENTSHEIYEATKDILRFLHQNETSNVLMEQINQIREETSATGFGNVAPSFLQSKPNWIIS